MPAAKRRPRNRTNSRRSRQAGTFSFGSFIGGAILGGAVVLAITYQSEIASPSGTTPDPPPVSGPVASDIKWKFIDMLANSEVRTGVPPVEQTPATDSGPGEFVLHAAQFLREEDAQVMQAELMLDGLPVSLSSSPRDLGGSWYRVLVGPYQTRPDAEQALQRLRARDIPAQLLARPLTGSAPPT